MIKVVRKMDAKSDPATLPELNHITNVVDELQWETLLPIFKLLRNCCKQPFATTPKNRRKMYI